MAIFLFVSYRLLAKLKMNRLGYKFFCLCEHSANPIAAPPSSLNCIILCWDKTRRIVNWNKPNSLVVQGEKFGLMRFGSRLDVYVPAGSAEVLVQVGDAVVAGETAIATYR